jgi:parvulin-like peptidyl-prolyl isomerase
MVEGVFLKVMSEKNFLKKIKISTIAYAVLAMAALALMASLVMVYVFPKSNAAAGLQRFLPYPAVMVGYRDWITYRELTENMASVKRFYEAQDFSKIGLRVDFSTDEGKKRFKVREKEVLNKMIEDDAIKILAKKRGITVSREEAAQAVARKLQEYDSQEDVVKDLERLYDWTLNDFQEKVVLPGLYQEKLQASFVEETNPAAAGKNKIGLAQEALRNKQSFADVAKQYSDGNTAKDGGSLGWFALEDLAKELRDPIAAQKVGVPGDVIESEIGFHIVLVEATKKEGEKQLYKLSQIFTRKITFADWLSEQIAKMSIIVLSPEYQYNKETARVEFKDKDMRDFEKNLFEKADGDAAFFF